jgi:hypothetical protein
LRAGWLFLALLPVALTAAMFLWSGSLAEQGWYLSADLNMPLRVALRAGAPALAVLIVPPAVAAWCGRRAERLGHPGGRDLYLVAIVVTAVSFALNLAPLLVVWGLHP